VLLCMEGGSEPPDCCFATNGAAPRGGARRPESFWTRWD
jgi:hypothetical protein